MKKNIVLLGMLVCFIGLAGAGFDWSDCVDDSDTLLGRSYYQSLIDNALERHWAVPIDAHYVFANKGFNCDGHSENLAKEIFCGCFTIQDIYLFSKLSAANLINRDGVLRDPLRPEPPSPDVGIAAAFGSYSDDLYTTLLADVLVDLDAHFSEFVFEVSALYNVTSRTKLITGTLGFIIPFKSRTHWMDYNLIAKEDTGLFREGPPVQAQMLKRDSLKDFYRDYSSITDFFVRAVLWPKGLCFEQHQQKNGIGDISLFALADFGNYFQTIESWQVGANIVFPSAGKENGNLIWEPVLGNGGAYQFEGYSQMLFRSCSNAFNPILRIMGQVSAPFSSCRRVPRLVQVEVEKVDGVSQTKVNGLLENPLIFEEYVIINDFAFFDSSIKGFADQTVKARTRYGPRVIASIGNYFYNAFNLGFRLGIFYDYMHKWKDSVCVCQPGIFDTNLLECNTDESMHTFGWNLTYKFENMVELNIGSQNVLGGKNVLQVNDFYASLILVF